ncbi:MAG: catechol 1,2-dioxygenase [Proteobacteria bacterium]|nr:catechol 1,2-dioxygenase [Pseudomonadota bacterium]
MGEVVGCGLIAHVPTIMLPEKIRHELNEGKDFSLVEGLHRLKREVLEKLDYDVVVVLDSHWFTTVEFVITSAERRSGKYTSDELPRGMSQVPYDLPGDPDFAELVASKAAKNGTWITPIADPCLPIQYATVNVAHYLQKSKEAWLSMSCAQTGETEDFLRVGRALGEAIADSGKKVLLLASGAMSHKFWPLQKLRAHEAAGVQHIFSSEHAAADLERIDWLKAGDHARVLNAMPEFLKFKPEANFGHYVMMAAALGERDFTAAGRLFSDYENSIGTGQVHIWFDRPAGGWTKRNKAAE